MARVNSNHILNVSAEAGDDGFIHEHSLEPYTVVLSATTHVLSMLFGGVGSIAVVVAIVVPRNINRKSYALVLFLLLESCSCNFIWSPMEVTDLIVFHYYHKHPCKQYVSMKTVTYLFLILNISFVIAFLSLEGTIRLKNCFGPLLRKTLSVYSSAIAPVTASFIVCVLIMTCLQTVDDINISYVTMDKHMRSFFLILTALALCLVLITLAVLLLFFTKETVYWENGRPHTKQKTMKLEIPEFLISQSNACADNDGGFGNSRSASRTPSPSTPKLLMVGDPETSSIKAEDGSHISELPISKPMGNKLGINMTQVLGRRRHTICQISDSSSVTSTPADPLSRAKQYNYVRKFSVDISALQAQLQNPKIFRDAPYQSDIDLSKRQLADNSQTQIQKPLLPLKPLSGHYEKEGAKMLEADKIGIESRGVTINISPPPVIMVSNDDTPADTGEEDIPNEFQDSEEAFHETTKSNANCSSPAQKPTTLNFDDTAEEHTSAPTLESAITDPSDTEPENRNMARLVLLLSLTFVLNMLPVLVTEVLFSRLSSHAFVNISTCTLAVSTIQTIVYPHLIASYDDVVHRSVQKLKVRIKRAFACCNDADAHNEADDSSSTDHV